MSVDLSWDLFILAFFGVVVAYSFIIGRNLTLKVISATYVAILCGDAVGNIFARYFMSSESFMKFLRLFSVGSPEQAVAFAKILVLISLVVIIAVRGSYDFNVDDEKPFAVRMSMSFVLGLLSAGLMMSAMLIFVSGGSLISGIAQANSPLADIYSDSRLVRLLIDYSNFFFFIPGGAIVMMNMMAKK
jgi:hypothetical protein